MLSLDLWLRSPVWLRLCVAWLRGWGARVGHDWIDFVHRSAVVARCGLGLTAWWIPGCGYQVTHVSIRNGYNITATRKWNKGSISEMCCANSSSTLKWPRELSFRNAPTTDSINRADGRSHITSTSISDDIAIWRAHTAATTQDMAEMSNFIYDPTRFSIEITIL